MYHIVVLLFITFLLYKLFASKIQHLPPGPIGLPIIGHLAFLGLKPHLKLTEWGKIYGKIFKINFGSYSTIILNDAKDIREAFGNSKFIGRPDNKAFKAISGGNQGLGNTEGEEWQEQRRFTFRHLKDFGFGKKSMESLITFEVSQVVNELRKHTGIPIDVSKRFSLAVLNSLLVILTGERYELEDPRLNKLLENYETVFRKLASNPLPLVFPSLMEVFPSITGWNSFMKVINSMHEMFKEKIESHKSTFNKLEEPRDFIDTYLNKIVDTKDVNSSFYQQRGESSLLGVLADLFGTGMDTTSVTLNWAILYLLTHQDVQEKVIEEINSVIGQSRPPSLSDKPMMPYTEAVILETLRKSSLAPLGVFHRATENGVLNGFDIPKGTLLVANLYAVHHDENLWENPNEFRPERFLEKGAKEGFLPFSTGKRACPGESLGRDSLFLFLTFILQSFRVKRNSTEPMPSLEPIGGKIFLYPQKYKLVLHERK